MATYGQQSTSRPFLLLAGFSVLSVIAHGLFLASRFDDTPDMVELVQVAPPLHVVVVSSRGTTTPENKSAAREKVAETSEQQHGKQAEIKPSAHAVTKHSPIQAQPESTNKPDQSPISPATKKPSTEKTTPDQVAKDTAQHAEQPAAAETLKPVPVNHLQAQLRSQLARHFTYPRLARRMGWEGQVGLGLRIGEDGRLGNIQVVRSSGYKVLDENARSTLDRIGHITVASNRTINPVDTEIDVLYRLRD